MAVRVHIKMNQYNPATGQIDTWSFKREAKGSAEFVRKPAEAAKFSPEKASKYIRHLESVHSQLRGRLYVKGALSVVRSNPHKAGSANKIDARELLLFTENDGDLYRMQFQPIAKNLGKKFKAGKYSSTKAAKLWASLADNAAKKYTFEYGERGAARSWHQIKGYGTFTAATRRLVGRLLEKSYHAEMKAGNFHA